ncbi:MAG: 1-acyl-sn-glycerol-3-phosphate acyltransferase [Bacteroidia bacterium]|nr:1-acyl-sn-glycerol-3-phosphate acyltransferase [Bacteroidia bacterium]
MKFLRKLAGIYFLLVFTIPFIVLYPFFLIFLSTPKLYPWANRLRKLWARIIVLFAFIRVKITYEEKPDKNKTYIYAANHSSYLDIISIGLIAPKTFSFMAKAELAKIPLFGIFFRTVDIAVDRKSMTASHKSFLDAAKRIKEGKSIVIFPEGTIGPQVPALKKFKPGAFRLAIDNGIDVIPVTFMHNWKMLPDDGSNIFRPGRMEIIIHRTVSTAHLKSDDAGALTDKIYTIIEEQLKTDPVNRLLIDADKLKNIKV